MEPMPEDCRTGVLKGMYKFRSSGLKSSKVKTRLHLLGSGALIREAMRAQDILAEKYGIAEFNKKCKELVWRYREQFENATDRLGFWLDMKNPYITYDNNYIESLWWIISEFNKKKLLYEGHKIVPWCTRCGTALSSHELAQGYKEVEDTSVYIKFLLNQKFANSELRVASGGRPTYILSWTTTPWTLPGNVALAVGEKIEYAMIRVGDENYILAKERLSAVFPDSTRYSLLATVPGKALVGQSYQPLFDVKPLKSKKSYTIYPADFVTTTDGTGVVHTAVMYGEDDYALGVNVGLPQHHTVNEQGHFTAEVKELAGLYAKSGKAEKAILDLLATRHSLLATASYKHEYPHCWRCGTALLYYARTSWFVAMSKLKKQLLAANQTVSWTPEHIKEGRFGEWLKDVKDWNFSRARYWGTPLPIWRSKDGKSQIVVSSFADFKTYGNVHGNKFFGMRHGLATHNNEQKNAGGRETDHLRSELTPEGIKQIEKAVAVLRKKKIDVIITSPYYRTEQTAKLVAKSLKKPVVVEKRLGEIDCGIFNWQGMDAYHAWYKKSIDRWTAAPENAETLSDVRARVTAALKAINEKYKNKNILIISHGDPLWVLEGAMRGLPEEQYSSESFYPQYAVPFEIEPPVLPLDEQGRFDVHKPYIDGIVLRDPKTKKELYRVPEVCDVWFDSGAMPFAQAHYPFGSASLDGTRDKQDKPFADAELEAKSYKLKAISSLSFPADYICEGVDQTRGWFYTLLAVATALGLKAPYKNVISVGIIHDKNGQKMSKSKGNIVDPLAVMKAHGADALRWYFYTINDPGDGKNFDEADVAKVTRKLVLILYNSFVFWNSYGARSSGARTAASTNVLDQWILAALADVTERVTKDLEAYDVGGAAKAIEQFTDDLSRWYIRRSRDRFQSVARGDSSQEADYEAASATLQHTLRIVSQLLAPFMPFFSEALYASVGGPAISVHLSDWPTIAASDKKADLLKHMDAVRAAAAAGLAARAEAKVKVRQPLSSLTLKNRLLQGKTELLALLADEVNVKSILFNEKQESEVVLDVAITPELKREGVVRELTRAIQGLRQSAGYQMSDEITLAIETTEELTDLIQLASLQLKKSVNAKQLELRRIEKFDAELETKIDAWPVWIGVRRV